MAQLVARLNGIQKVIGSNPISSTNIRGYSTVGSAIRSQRIGQGFESPYLHHRRRIRTLGAVCMQYRVRRLNSSVRRIAVRQKRKSPQDGVFDRLRAFIVIRLLGRCHCFQALWRLFRRFPWVFCLLPAFQ